MAYNVYCMACNKPIILRGRKYPIKFIHQCRSRKQTIIWIIEAGA